MKVRVFNILLLMLLPHLLLAQITKNINAVIEDERFLCILDTITLYPDSTVIHWKLKSKTRSSIFDLSENASLKELESGIKHIQMTPFKERQKAIRFKKRYEIKEFKTCFPAINDSALISIYLSPTIYVDSLKLKSENFFYEVYRYRAPLNYHQPLNTKADSIKYSSELYNEGVNLFKNRDFQLSLILFEKSRALERQLRTWYDYLYLGGDFNEEMWIANCYYKLGEIEEAKKYSSTYYVEPYEKQKRSKADSLSIMSDTIYDQSKLNVLNEICVLDSLYIGGTSFRFAESLYNLGCQYSTMRKFQNAKHILERAKNIITERYKEKNWLLSFIYKELASISYNENDIVSAIKYMKRCLLEGGRDSIQIIDDSSISSDYNTLAHYYSVAGDWRNALQIMRMRVEYWKGEIVKNPHKVLSPIGPFTSWYDVCHAYSDALSDFASICRDAGLHKQALRTYKASINILGENSGYRSGYVTFQNLGIYYHGLGDDSKALIYYEKAKESYLSFPGNSEFQDYYLGILNSIAIAQATTGDVNKAIEIQKDIILKVDSVIRRTTGILGQWNSEYNSYTNYLSNLSRFYNLNHQYDSALVYEKKSLEFKMKYNSIHSELAYSYMNLGYSYAGLKEWDQALFYTLKAFNIYKRNNEPTFYLRSLSDLANCYYHAYDYANLEKSVLLMEDAARQNLVRSLQDLTYNERSKYIENYSEILNAQIPRYAYYTMSDSLVSATYNSCLTMKGALLSSENSVKRVIEESKDKALIDIWDEMKADRYIMSKELEKDSLDRKLDVDSLQKTIYDLEDSLMVKCKEYGDITQSMKLKWSDVKKSLRPEDIAIEFLSFPIQNDSVMYVALTLRKESESPKMTVLFEEKQLKGVSDSLYYQCKDMADLVWGPLLQELKDIRNIYFSPAGVLYNIGIEYLPGMENYNLYRLSSTRELVPLTVARSDHFAVLYGGLDYYAGLTALATNQKSYITDEVFVEHANVRGMKLRGGKELLPQTKIEVEQIAKELKKEQWNYNLLTGDDGTEESFKSLSGRRVNTLHISTHGFYYTPEEADKIGYNFLRMDNRLASPEDKSLTRSGLIMSGANHILEGEELPDDVEDGILTAKEIANVDLRGLDLVVLSACQTGLGDISQGEGVFGLQRGFKKAGAKSILMSLWEVDDKATQILMTQFYKNLVAGMSKRQSLQSAQKYLRMYKNEKGEQCYNEPKYWAAFILLDGIEKN